MYKLLSVATVKRYSTIQNSTGGNVLVLAGSWNKYTEIRQRSYSATFQFSQPRWEYSHLFIQRYEQSRPTLSSDVIYYEGYRHKITGIVIETEAGKRYEKIYASRIDSNINEDSPMATDNVKVYEYTGIADEYSFTATELIGAKVIGAFKDGTQYMVTDNENLTNKEVSIDVTNGFVKWSTPFEAGMKAMIQYE